MSISLASHGLAAIAFLCLAALIAASYIRSRSRPAFLLLLASGLTLLWALGVCAESLVAEWPHRLSRLMELAKLVGWLLFLGELASRTVEKERAQQWRRIFLRALVAIVAAAAIVETIFVTAAPFELSSNAALLVSLSRIALTIIGFLLIENLIRNADSDSLWSLKFAIVAISAILTYDFVLYSSTLLLRDVDVDLFEARGVVVALTAPLLAVASARNRSWAVNIHVSRSAVFHTATLVGSGGYLLAMAATGYYLRIVGGVWGPLLQVAFLCAAVLVLLLTLFSGSVRARLRILIAQNFFSYRYDYRDEWLKFISTMSASEGRLSDRAIKAVARIVDSPAGALWVRRESEASYVPAGHWNLPVDAAFIPDDDSVVGYLRDSQRIINLPQFAADPASHEGLDLSSWLASLRRAWLVIPCLHRGELQGFIVLGTPRVTQRLDWEEYNLLRTVGLQVASYLAEEDALQALLDARQFEEFNRRFAFVVHDIKNLNSQLSLLLSNAAKHGGNPEFQRDVINTVRNSVEKMGTLLAQLKKAREAGPPEETSQPTVDLRPLLLRLSGPYGKGSTSFELALAEGNFRVAGSEERLSAMFAHLLQNAVDATNGAGQVTLRLFNDGQSIVTEVCDDGPGMDADFVRDELFRPLQTTKGEGFGIGAYQAREIARDHGGRLEVQTAPGAGTTMRVSLPRHDDGNEG
ncbi:XrtA/PEP-CTERM system histidine kinase PrsK [Oceanibacterium hippocampi]|uniref:histidine kinase n=1 Tax=Oceanibacterium hippocampi TaxID=745714 RepID=A0A1Y5TQB4_9PROT|nr:XrtA/PEP-CTERM system histidine kinase PrsK [Oceanibacterium hippocampi]SLN69010.1 C4-dicarboxylate transport sensor protein DctB [Oceanibacterium hippocampi]